jgi:hypothetical protein
MRKKIHFLSAVLIFLILLLSCTSPEYTVKTESSPIQPVKLLCVYDCAVISKPSPDIVEIGESERLISVIKKECENRFKTLGYIDSVKSFETVGYGLKRQKILPVRHDTNGTIDSSAPPFYVSDTAYGFDNTIGDILYLLFTAETDSSISYGLSRYFKQDSNLSRLKELKRFTNTDYCMVNSMYGTTKRRPISDAIRIGTAIATGLLAVLSPVGGIVYMPGDETVFTSRSYVIDLTTGDITWRKKYGIYQLYAVENFNEMLWGNKVFKKFKVRKK